MPNVTATLAYFEGLEGFKTCLLTGNTTTGAYLKLQRYGIDKYFDSHYAVCGELSEDRSELAKIAPAPFAGNASRRRNQRQRYFSYRRYAQRH